MRYRYRPKPDRPYVRVDANGCWNWLRTLTRGGYGQLKHRRKDLLAHRFTYTTAVGPIPGGYQIDHLCRNRACVNPAHLEAVTPRENTARSNTKSGVVARTNVCHRGHAMTPENTYLRKNRKGRWCLACRKMKGREWWQANPRRVVAA